MLTALIGVQPDSMHFADFCFKKCRSVKVDGAWTHCLGIKVWFALVNNWRSTDFQIRQVVQMLKWQGSKSSETFWPCLRISLHRPGILPCFLQFCFDVVCSLEGCLFWKQSAALNLLDGLVLLCSSWHGCKGNAECLESSTGCDWSADTDILGNKGVYQQ